MLWFTLVVVSYAAAVLAVVGRVQGSQQGTLEYSSSSYEEELGSQGGLKLTPFIRAGKFREARQASRVTLGGIVSYSGFLTVNSPDCGSNLFFWFFPAFHNSKSAPVILWHGGGPGTSGLVGLFTEHGPFYFPGENTPLTRRNTSWVLNHSVIYLDSPVGSGFSYTEDDNCYCETSAEVARDVYEGLVQFFTLFSNYKKNDFFVSSGSYGGKFAPAIGYKIHLENRLLSLNKQHQRINLKGLTIASGFTDPLNQIDYGDFYYDLGLISEKQLDHFKREEQKTKDFIKQKQWEDAFNTCEPLIIGCCYPQPSKSYLENTTGFNNTLNLLYTDKQPSLLYHKAFVDSSETRRFIHVDNVTFHNTNSYVYEKLKSDIYQSLKATVEELLNAGYRLLIYSGQLDLIVPHTSVRKYVATLQWMKTRKFHESKSSIWKLEDVRGYIKSGGGLTYVLLRKAGHKISHDQPQWASDMITNFTRGHL